MWLALGILIWIIGVGVTYEFVWKSQGEVDRVMWALVWPLQGALILWSESLIFICLKIGFAVKKLGQLTRKIAHSVGLAHTQ